MLTTTILTVVLCAQAIAAPCDDCSEIQQRQAQAQAELEALQSEQAEVEAVYDANLESQLDSIEAENQAIREYNSHFESGANGGAATAARADSGGLVTVTMTYPDGRSESSVRDNRRVDELRSEITSHRETRWELEREARALQDKLDELLGDILGKYAELDQLAAALANCLRNCANQVILIDPSSHVAIHVVPGVDPQDIINDYGLTDAEVVPVPEAAGGGHLISAPKPGKDAVAQLEQDSRSKEVDNDFCREFLPGTELVPHDKLPLQLAQNASGSVLTGGAEQSSGAPLAGTSVTVLPDDPPVDGANPGWQADDSKPPAMAVTGDEGQYSIPVSKTLRSGRHIILAGNGWTTVATRSGQSPGSGPSEEDIEEVVVTGPRHPLGGGPKGPSSPSQPGGKVDDDAGLDEVLVTGARIGTSGTRIAQPGIPPVPGAPPEGEETQTVGILLRHDDWSWVPQYAKSTRVTAKLYVPDPSRPGIWIPSNTPRRHLTVRFGQRSTEPGISMNQNLRSVPQDAPDLYLDTRLGVDCSADPTGKNRFFGTCTTLKRVNQKRFVVRSSDYGSYSTMEALCPGCVPLRALHPARYLSGYTPPSGFPDAVVAPDPATRLIRVPHDDNANNIADGYELDLGVTGISPTDDSERIPHGNGVQGDGFSAYEEYRGFRAQGGHYRSDWHRKTFAVFNDTGFPLDKFRQASQLEVLEIKETGHRDRIANFNHNFAHVVDQHCILFIREDPGEGWSGMSYGIGPPKNVTKVVIDPDYNDDSHQVVAHELGHATGVRHHGDKKHFEVEVHRDSNLFSSVVHSYVHPESHLCEVLLPATFDLGYKGDQTSGVENCIMRYNNWADIYQQSDSSFHCHDKGKERLFFCESRTGTGQNANGNVSGDATRGDCKGQFVVNDNS